MILALLEDRVVRVYDTTADAELDVEPLDAVDTFRAVFDDSAVPYRIEWLVPNSKDSLFGFSVVENGRYRLIPAGPPDPAALLALLASTDNFEPPARISEVRALQTRLRTALPNAG